MKKSQGSPEEMFALDTNETAILRFLEIEPLSISTLARKSEIPRTTINGLLASLLRRGFIEIIPHGKRKLYRLRSYEVVERNVQALQKKLYPHTPFLNILGVRVGEDTEIKIHRGAQTMLGIFERIGKENKNKRVIGIQPNASIYNVLQKLPIKDIVRINDSIRKNNVIMEAVLEENSTAFLAAVLNKKDAKALIESFMGRRIDHVSVPSEFLQFESEIYITPEMAFIMEWDAEVGIEIRNPHILKLLTAMFYATKALGKRFNQGEDMTNYLKKLEQKPEILKIEK